MAEENSSDSDYDEKLSKAEKKIIERSHKEAFDNLIREQKLKITSERKKSNKKSKIKPFACESCGVGYDTSSNLERHIRATHSELIEPKEKQNLQTNLDVLVLPIEQNILGNDGNHIASLHIQLQTSNDEVKQKSNAQRETQDTFQCEVCSKEFRYKCDLKSHFVVHSKEKPFACESCDVRCKRLSHLNSHIRTKHSKLIEPKEKKNLQTNHDVLVLPIEQNILTSDENKKPNAERETQERFQCEVCSSRFRCESELKRHLVVHTKEKPFACESCDLQYGTSSNLKRHIRTIHSELVKPIETEKKNLQTNNDVLVQPIERNILANDENHIASIHIQLQTFGCDYCEKTFEVENDKSDHVNTNHLKDHQTLLALADIFNKENNKKEASKKMFLLGRKMNQSTEEMQKIINM